jgi:uncharacterized SAM-dependent methyltransferase
MPGPIDVLIHPSQFPENVRRDLLESLRTRRINHKFHYQTAAQTDKWLALHEAHSPARTDPECAATYDRGFAEAIRRLDGNRVHLVGLGCGGGHKDIRLLRLLRDQGKTRQYTPVDVGVSMVLTACQAVSEWVAADACHPLVCDLATAADLDRLLDRQPAGAWPRLVTFFGMIPNFEPSTILARLARLVHPGDHLLFSANLAPGPDYARGVQAVLPQYDNELTRDWLLTFLLDLGVERGDGETRFFVEDRPREGVLKRITCVFRFTRARTVRVYGERFAFESGESVRLFFSYRYLPDRMADLLAGFGLPVRGKWLTPSGEEGVFLCRRQ